MIVSGHHNDIREQRICSRLANKSQIIWRKPLKSEYMFDPIPSQNHISLIQRL